MNKVLPLQPHFVIMMHNINDMIILLYEGTYWNHKKSRSPILIVDRRPTISQLIGLPFRFLPHTHAALGALYVRLTVKKTDEFARIRGKKLTIHKKNFLKEFETNLKTFVSICRIRGITPVLMTQQNRMTSNPDDFIRKIIEEKFNDLGLNYEDIYYLYQDFNDTIRQVSKAEKVFIIDLDKDIPKKNIFMYDIVHLNDQGSLFTSSVIANRLKPLVMKHYSKHKKLSD
jgi:hypothetical protein